MKSPKIAFKPEAIFTLKIPTNNIKLCSLRRKNVNVYVDIFEFVVALFVSELSQYENSRKRDISKTPFFILYLCTFHVFIYDFILSLKRKVLVCFCTLGGSSPMVEGG